MGRSLDIDMLSDVFYVVARSSFVRLLGSFSNRLIGDCVINEGRLAAFLYG